MRAELLKLKHHEDRLSFTELDLFLHVRMPIRVTGPQDLRELFARGLESTETGREFVSTGLGGWQLPRSINVGPIIPAELTRGQLEQLLVEAAEELRRRAVGDDNGCQGDVEACEPAARNEAICG